MPMFTKLYIIIKRCLHSTYILPTAEQKVNYFYKYLTIFFEKTLLFIENMCYNYL